MNPNEVPSNTVAVFDSLDQASSAVKMLNKEGIDMKKISVIGQDYHTEEQPIGFINTGDRMATWGKFGAIWGGIWGLLIGSAMMFIPGLGYLYLAGWIVSGIEGAVLGGAAGALGGALSGIGIPKDSIVRYETAVRAGQYLVIFHGTPEEASRARTLLGSSGAQVETIAAETSPAKLL